MREETSILKENLIKENKMYFIEGYDSSNANFTWLFKSRSPIIITVPHDQGFRSCDFFGFFQQKKNGAKVRDKYVWPIVKDILLGTKVNVVRGLFPRKFVDYNRAREKAFEDNRLEDIYDYYHQATQELLREVVKIHTNRKCLLLDMHGFTNQPEYGKYDLILGTGNRTTVNSDVDQLFADFMIDRNYKVFLPADETLIQGKKDDFNGGFTIRNYAKQFDIDAIQIEIARKFRVFGGGEIGRKLSTDIADFLNTYFDLEN